MRSRRLVVSAAVVVAASVGFIPGMAQAAGPAAGPSAPVAKGVPAPGADLVKLGASEVKKFHSPAEHSVRKALPAAKGKTAATAQSAEAAAGNPDLGLVLDAQSTSAHGIELRAQVLSSPGATLRVTYNWGDGTTDGVDAFPGQEVSLKHSYAELGEYNVKVTVTDAVNQAEVVNELPLSTVGSDFTPYAPTRLLDTRTGTGAPMGMVQAYSSAKVKIAGNGKIPAGVTAVALNVTVTNAANPGHVTAFPGGTTRPTTSNLNFEARQTVPNMVVVPVGKDGTVELYNGSWTQVDLIADITGYFTRTAASGYTPMTPVRAVDTRSGQGAPQGQVPGRGTIGVQLGGWYVPANATAVALNVTATNPREDGHLTAYPSGQQAPNTSNVNFAAKQTVANSVIVPVGPDGKVNVFNGAWAGTDVIVDVVGYYSPDSSGSFMAIAPNRRFDTRTWDGPMHPRGYIWSAISHGEQGISGYVLNATVTNTKDAGFLSVAPDTNTPDQYKNHTEAQQTRPTASAMNWTAGKTVANLVQASSGGVNGVVDFWNQSWDTTDLIVDIFGYYETK
ncbi:PKD domain-containing protein [Streptomyces sp. NBC_00354]|uniref:PKD domain-containing protein n=1 Tax=Streptomyces sp. NBC_00354 TaxID=2975723 RepID=UPI002E276DD5|nr:PKD domain-containing protein [Streptomyces sp. NBC_01001]